MSSSTHSCYVHRATTYNNVQVFQCDFSVTVKSKKNSWNNVSTLSVNSFIKKIRLQIVKIVKRYFQFYFVKITNDKSIKFKKS